MPSTLLQKLKIKGESVLLTINAPVDFVNKIKAFPGIKITNNTSKFDQIHWFVKKQEDLKKDIDKVNKLIIKNIICWIYYPKGTSGIQTDLTRDKGWDVLKLDKFQWLSLISLDDTWSAFSFRMKKEEESNKLKEPAIQPILNYLDLKNKIVNLPDDFEKTLKKYKEEYDYFNKLAFSHKKEYVNWIVSAKKENTRQKRIMESIEHLKNKWKNPSNN